MAFLVYGRDVPDLASALDGLDEDELDEAHQSYMDGWAAELIARGPTLSPDGSTHTGSVHIVDLPEAGDARQFAFEEPYFRAGLYQEVTVVRFVPVVEGTMWDRPAPSADQPATYLLATLAEAAFGRDAAVELRNAFGGAVGTRWVFAGALLSDDSTTVQGVAAAVDLGPTEADDLIRAAIARVPASPIDVDRHRWRRGGRPTE